MGEVILGTTKNLDITENIIRNKKNNKVGGREVGTTKNLDIKNK